VILGVRVRVRVKDGERFRILTSTEALGESEQYLGTLREPEITIPRFGYSGQAPEPLSNSCSKRSEVNAVRSITWSVPYTRTSHQQ
jgi:hypothetical protein